MPWNELYFWLLASASFCCRAQCSVPLAQRSKCFPHQHAHHVQLPLVTPLPPEWSQQASAEKVYHICATIICLYFTVSGYFVLFYSNGMFYLLQHNIGQLFQPEIAYRDLLACCEACHACLREGSPIKCKSVPAYYRSPPIIQLL